MDWLRCIQVFSIVLIALNVQLICCQAAAVRSDNNNASEPVYQVKTISRDEWLAKEYFGYLCGPDECINQSNKSRIRQECFAKHTKLNQVLQTCYKSDHECNETNDEKTLECVMEASRNDATLIPMELHVCVDDMITLQIWKCIRRFHLVRWAQIVDKMRKQGKGKDSLAANITALVAEEQDLVSPS